MIIKKLDIYYFFFEFWYFYFLYYDFFFIYNIELFVLFRFDDEGDSFIFLKEFCSFFKLKLFNL